MVTGAEELANGPDVRGGWRMQGTPLSNVHYTLLYPATRSASLQLLQLQLPAIACFLSPHPQCNYHLAVKPPLKYAIMQQGSLVSGVLLKHSRLFAINVSKK